ELVRYQCIRKRIGAKKLISYSPTPWPVHCPTNHTVFQRKAGRRGVGLAEEEVLRMSATPNALSLPDDLTELDQWVLWRYERGTKVPYQVNGRRASSADPSTWASFEAAVAVWSRRPEFFAGVGWMFYKSNRMVGID